MERRGPIWPADTECHQDTGNSRHTDSSLILTRCMGSVLCVLPDNSIMSNNVELLCKSKPERVTILHLEMSSMSLLIIVNYLN